MLGRDDRTVDATCIFPQPRICIWPGITRETTRPSVQVDAIEDDTMEVWIEPQVSSLAAPHWQSLSGRDLTSPLTHFRPQPRGTSPLGNRGKTRHAAFSKSAHSPSERSTSSPASERHRQLPSHDCAVSFLSAPSMPQVFRGHGKSSVQFDIGKLVNGAAGASSERPASLLAQLCSSR